MSEALADFFAQMRPFLLGERSLAATRDAVGPSPSGDEAFAFYRVLVERNLFRILTGLYGPLRTLLMREHDGFWGSLVRAYVQAHPPPAHWHPNEFGREFPEFLAAQREGGEARLVPLHEEIADFCWVRHEVHGCPDDVGDGFDRRLFVRQYTAAVPELVAALEADPEAPLPEPRPVVVLVHRHWRHLNARVFYPSAAGLVALARRQGAPIPEPLRAVPLDDVETADTLLVEHGVLLPRADLPDAP